MYFDLMGPHFVIAVRSCLGNDWYEALEYHWLALFNIIVYVMKFGWNLQRAEEQKNARQLMSKRGGEAKKSWKYKLLFIETGLHITISDPNYVHLNFKLLGDNFKCGSVGVSRYFFQQFKIAWFTNIDDKTES